VNKLIFKMKESISRKILYSATHIFGPVAWRCGVVFLTRYNANPHRIGELAHQFDLYLKMAALGIVPRHKSILLAPKKSISNQCLLDYWSEYATIITNPILIALLLPICDLTQYDIARPKLDGERLHGNIIHYEVQKRWEKEGRKPLLKLTEGHIIKGWDTLRKMGIPKDSYFVCLHVRESGYLKNYDSNSVLDNDYRDADINTYSKAIETIVNAGGYVIRMGDPTMSKSSNPNIIDYVHSPYRSDWMDIFLCASCRFFLGTTSGLFIVAFVFGTPSVLTNFTPLRERPFSENDIYIPKLYYDWKHKHTLTFKEASVPGLLDCYDSNKFKEKNIEMINNTEDEINDVVLEMLNEKQPLTKLQQKFNKIIPYVTNGKISDKFLQRHEKLLK